MTTEESSFKPSAPSMPYHRHWDGRDTESSAASAERNSTMLTSLPAGLRHDCVPGEQRPEPTPARCCCFSLSMCCRVHATLSVILAMLGLSLELYVGAHTLETAETETIVLLAVTIPLLVAMLATATVVINGSSKNRTAHLLWYIIVLSVHIVWMVAAIFASIMALLRLDAIPIFVAYLAFLIWGVVCSSQLRASAVASQPV